MTRVRKGVRVRNHQTGGKELTIVSQGQNRPVTLHHRQLMDSFTNDLVIWIEKDNCNLKDFVGLAGLSGGRANGLKCPSGF